MANEIIESSWHNVGSAGLTVGAAARRRVYTVSPRHPLRQAISIMAYRAVGSLVVVEERVPIGILTETDVVRLANDDLLDCLVREVMSRPVITIDEEEHMAVALMLMTEKRIRHIPVVRGAELVGIVTHRELLKWILEHPDAFSGFLPYVGTSTEPLLALLRLFHLVPSD